MRRLKTVGVSIPAVTGPFTSVHCTLSLLRSSLRRSPALTDGEYARQGDDDSRFADYYGTVESVVTSGGSNDSGLFETDLRDERFLPFEGAGAVGTWRLELPGEFRTFDYDTITDVVLHLRYTARGGGARLRDAAVANVGALVGTAGGSGLTRLFSLRHDFPDAWYGFATGTEDFQARVRKEFFPYFAQGMTVSVDAVELYGVAGDAVTSAPIADLDPGALTDALGDTGGFDVSLPADSVVMRRAERAEAFLLVRYSVS
jgi:hypothetical protein